ncbi:hypothetical protein L2E82_02095 [Cichorium intybus]|uniref:Uncharacterized protein n=1 Tax=Cichorium intybus TaxID=13427 RepID=A0ACB9H184_CICIN|nr:hypothetical protein L2E82_02095 [Cichorium intybus]
MSVGKRLSGKIIVRSELGTYGQVLKRTRVGVEDSSRAPTIESTGSAFESGVGLDVTIVDELCKSDTLSLFVTKKSTELEFYPFPYKRSTCIRDGHIITIRESADDIVVWCKGIHVGSEYYERIWDHLLGGATSIVVGTTYAMGLLVLVVGTTYSVGPLLKREYEAEINDVVNYNQVVQVEMTARHDEYTLMLLNWGFMR